MIFRLSAKVGVGAKTFYIGLDSEVEEYNSNSTYSITSSGKFTKYTKTFQRITKEYRNLSGKVITYGVRSRYKTIDFTIECLYSDYQYILEVLNSAYEYNVTEYYPNQEVNMKLSGDLKESKICNGYQDGEALYTLSGTLVEV